MKSTGRMFYAPILNRKPKWRVRNRVMISNGWQKTAYSYHTINHVTYDIP